MISLWDVQAGDPVPYKDRVLVVSKQNGKSNTDVGMQRHGRLSLPRDEHLQSHLPNLFQNVLDLFLSSYVLDYLMEMDTCLLVLMEMDRMELLAIRKVES